MVDLIDKDGRVIATMDDLQGTLLATPHMTAAVKIHDHETGFTWTLQGIELPDGAESI